MQRQLTLSILAFLTCVLAVSAQEEVMKINNTIRKAFVAISSSDPGAQHQQIYGNYGLDSRDVFKVYTVQQIDKKNNDILDSLKQYRLTYQTNRKIDFDSTYNFLMEVEKNLKKSIDQIPSIVTTMDIIKLMKSSIIQELKDTDLADKQSEIDELRKELALLKDQVAELKKAN